MSSNEYHLPLMKLFTVDNNYLALIKIFTVSNNNNNNLLFIENIYR